MAYWVESLVLYSWSLQVLFLHTWCTCIAQPQPPPLSFSPFLQVTSLFVYVYDSYFCFVDESIKKSVFIRFLMCTFLIAKSEESSRSASRGNLELIWPFNLGHWGGSRLFRACLLSPGRKLPEDAMLPVPSQWCPWSLKSFRKCKWRHQ